MNTFLFRYFAFVLAVVTCCSALSIKPVTILPQIKALQDELCNGTAVAVKAISKIAPSYKVRALTWILGYQNNVLGPQTFTWINTVARANATLMASILLTEDASLFFDILNYVYAVWRPKPICRKNKLDQSLQIRQRFDGLFKII